MTRILIVEDDAAQSKLLARAISQRKPEYVVLTAPSGSHAISLLERESVDLVLTDLQMCDVDGFALLGWLSNHRPSVLAFSMTAYGTEETCARLDALGSLACFTKPLDVASLLRTMSQGLSENVRGHVQNVSLASFLQLMEMEQKTCTLTVQEEGRSGTLFLRKGELLDAELGELDGEPAALAILSFPHPGITIDATCRRSARRIERPLSFLLMEAMRVRDEEDERHSRELSLAAPEPEALEGGLHALLVIETATGRLLAGRRSDDDLPRASAAAHWFRAALSAHGSVEELVANMRGESELMRPLGPDRFALACFDPTETTLAMARLELARFMGAGDVATS